VRHTYRSQSETDLPDFHSPDQDVWWSRRDLNP
jgi:hypothetical protein